MKYTHIIISLFVYNYFVNKKFTKKLRLIHLKNTGKCCILTDVERKEKEKRQRERKEREKEKEKQERKEPKERIKRKRIKRENKKER